MIGAALLAKKAVEKGLTSKPWVKTTLAPGSKVVSDYYEKAGLTPYLDKLGFNLVGYGCTTCIGNSGPLIPEVSQAVNDNDLAVVSVLSGNRNFEGRINPDVKMNYLASPPLVVAYALAGSMDVDLFNDPLGQDQDGNDVFMKDIWPTAGGGRGRHRDARSPPRCSPPTTPTCSPATSTGRRCRRPRATPSSGTPSRRTSASRRTSTACPTSPSRSTDIEGARVLLQARRLGHHRPHLARPARSRRTRPAGSYLADHGVEQRDFNSYGSRRGNHEVMIRGTFANIRLRNQLAPGTEGGFTRDFTTGEGDDAEVTTVYEASEHYLAAGTPLVVLAGKEYGSGSSRDWAAKGTALLGVKAVIAESYERIHRSNLIGMGVLPLQYPEGETAESLGLTGEETFSISGVTALNDGSTPRTVKVTRRPRRATRSSSTRWSASTPRARRTTTATAGSCSTSCAACARADPNGLEPRVRHRCVRVPPCRCAVPCWLSSLPSSSCSSSPQVPADARATRADVRPGVHPADLRRGAASTSATRRPRARCTRSSSPRAATSTAPWRRGLPVGCEHQPGLDQGPGRLRRQPGLEVRRPDRVPRRPCGPGLQHRHDPHTGAKELNYGDSPTSPVGTTRA